MLLREQLDNNLVLLEACLCGQSVSGSGLTCELLCFWFPPVMIREWTQHQSLVAVYGNPKTR